MPADPYVSCPGRALASAVSSFTFFTGKDGCTARMSGLDPTSVMGVKSRIESYGSLRCRLAFTAWPLGISTRV